MARDASFYRWPPAIRLFHPFVPHKELPNAAGRLASWIDTVFENEFGEEEDAGCGATDASGNHDDNGAENSSMYLRPFEVTLDSILILPHWEILDARIEALEDSRGDRGRRDEEDRAGRLGRQRQRRGGRRQEQYAYDDNNNYYQDTDDYYDNNKNDAVMGGTQEMEYLRRKAEGTRLIEDEERKGIERKKERERKRRMREGGGGDGIGDDTDTTVHDEYNPTASSPGGENDVDDDDDKPNNASSYNGPCVVYLSPDDASRYRLESLRERLRVELFPNFNAFSPGSSVSPYPEYLPRPRSTSSSGVGGGGGDGGDGGGISKFRPLLPIGRFATVDDAVAVAKVLQSTWDPLTFNVTDIQFISRKVAHDNEYEYFDPPLGGTTSIAAPNTGQLGGVMNSDSFSGGVGFGRTTTTSVNRMAITTSGEVEDVSRQGMYGCDAMVMLWGEEPEEELMDREASLAMMMDDDDDDNDGGTNDSAIDYGKVFATAEREYRRMQTHEILSAKNSSPSSNYLDDDDDDDQGAETDESTSEIEAWLDDDDESLEDEGATVVIGRAQFFMGANREFVG
jgi:hypothetical protein